METPKGASRRFFEDFTRGTTEIHGPLSVDRRRSIAFAREFDPQPFHLDGHAARESFVGELIASGLAKPCALMMRLLADGILQDARFDGRAGHRGGTLAAPPAPRRCRAAAAPACWKPGVPKSAPGMGRIRFRFELVAADDTVLVDQTNWIMFGTRDAQAAAPIRYGQGAAGRRS